MFFAFFETLLINSISLFEREWMLFSIIGFVILIEVFGRSIKSRLKKKIFSQYDISTDPKHAEFYLEYYRKSQIIDLVRALSFIIMLFMILVSKAGLNINFLAIAAGALIIIFKDFLLSIVAFFIIMRKFRIGDTIALGENQGQIIFIRTFSVGLLGKDNDGDSTGGLYEIPSHRFITETIRKEELKASSIRKELIRIPFKTGEYGDSFPIFLESLKGHIDDFLPVCNRKNAGNYQTYIGYRYKLDIDYLEEKCIIITIGIVGKWDENVKNKEKIISFVESKKICSLTH